jgi:MYXO-CTERM domain-containing protein
MVVSMGKTTGLWALLLLAPLGVVSEGTAHADGPAGRAAVSLRPTIHIDRFGRTLEDVCPELTPGGRRCYAQRIVPPGQKPRTRPQPTPFGGGSACASEGGGGGSSPPSGTEAPTDIRTAYNIPSSASAAGKIVALVELPSTHALADVNAYRSAFGIPTLPSCPTDSSGVPTPGGTACFARVGEDGTVNTVTSSDCAGWSGETGLDMDMVSAACPDCSIVLVEANNTNDLDAMNSIAATVVHASAVSNSWGAPESGGDDQTPYSSSGILTLAASGDTGYLNEGEGANAANFPASSIYVLAVGGTTLEKSGGSYGEVVWNDGSEGGAGGSGCSQEFSMPSWQTSSGFGFGGCSKRASVDVSAAAEFAPSSEGGGIAAYDADDGGWNAVVGTSAASPLVAAIMVRLGLGGADQHELFYGHIGDFNDITSGSNDLGGSCGTLMCSAGTGWDGPSGLGSPNATALSALAGSTPPPPSDGGTTPPPSDGGTTPPPGTDSGTGTTPPGDGSDGGQTVLPGTDGGTGSSSGGGLGGLCSGPAECASNLCVSPTSGSAGVCSQSCETEACPSGYSCNGGYCFSSGGAGDNADGSGSSGCSSSPASGSSPLSGAGWVALGFLAVIKRRRRSR